MTVLLSMLGYLAESVHVCRIRSRCIRHGHALRCCTDTGHICCRCGRYFP